MLAPDSRTKAGGGIQTLVRQSCLVTAATPSQIPTWLLHYSCCCHCTGHARLGVQPRQLGERRRHPVDFSRPLGHGCAADEHRELPDGDGQGLAALLVAGCQVVAH